MTCYEFGVEKGTYLLLYFVNSKVFQYDGDLSLKELTKYLNLEDFSEGSIYIDSIDQYLEIVLKLNNHTFMMRMN